MSSDLRNIVYGHRIPCEHYSDQPYVVVNADGSWTCVVTTGMGVEGNRGQHVVALRSTDQGKTWSEPVAVEPADGPEASYAVLLKTPSGRIYCFYNHNTDNLRDVIADDPPFKGGKCKRVDSLGYFVFKYSDDQGRSWSGKRYVIPVREMAIDRENPYGGKVRFFWNVGKPFVHERAAYVSLHKVGGFGHGFFTRSEGVLLKSEDILTEGDPKKIAWETLPDADAGLRTPPGGGPIAEEQSYCVLSDGSFYCVYRTIDGHPAFTYSRDRGRTWAVPQYKRYADGRLMKHPRAANFVWKCANGKYLYWFHNHGGRFVREAKDAGFPYNDRNPAWLCGGVEADTPQGKIIRWSQPEILLYDDDPFIRMSYPDLIEDRGRYFVTETQKNLARVHEVDSKLLEGLWNQFALRPSAIATEGLALTLPEKGEAMPSAIPMPKLPDFCTRDAARADYGTKDLRQGFTLDLWLRLDSLSALRRGSGPPRACRGAAGQVILDNRTDNGKGFCLQTTSRETIEIVLNDGRTENRWDCDPGICEAGKLHHVVVIVDGGPKIIVFVVDGRLCDGGEFRQFGWGRFSPHLRGAAGDQTLRIGPDLKGRIETLRIYNRCLRISEAIVNHRASPAHE
jgi:hypothetical protein